MGLFGVSSSEMLVYIGLIVVTAVSTIYLKKYFKKFEE